MELAKQQTKAAKMSAFKYTEVAIQEESRDESFLIQRKKNHDKEESLKSEPIAKGAHPY